MAEGDDTGNGNIHEIFNKIIHFGSPTGATYGEKHEADTPNLQPNIQQKL